MIVKGLELTNFRNYESLFVNPSEGVNIFFGDNAQGKTNILESIYYCSTTKSHKGSRDQEIIRFDCDESHIRLYVSKKDKDYRIDVHLRRNKTKSIAVNGIPLKKTSDLLGIFNVIFFSPEDLDIIKSGPSERRRFIDVELCQLDKMYVYNLVNYNKVLNQRNRVLKDMYFEPSLKYTLDVWDKQLAEYGMEIVKRREKFIKEINEIIKPVHGKISNNTEDIELIYEPNAGDNIANLLRESRDKDIRYKTTSVGPHRDDLIIETNGINVRTYGSQGQKRSAALSLKLSEIEIVKRMINDMPVLLLDDVLSELDSSRQNQLLKSLDGVQSFITCTGLDDFVENRFKIDKLFNVVNGEVFERSSHE